VSSQLFILAIMLAFVSWFIVIIEMIAIHSFSRLFFGFGIPVYKTTLKIDEYDWFKRPIEVVKKDEGKFKFTEDGYIYFLSQFFFGKFFRTTTLFPFKATAKITVNGRVEIKARMPLGPTLFLFCWVVGWTAGTVGMSIESGNYGAMLFGLIGWGFAALMVRISYPVEKKRMDLMVSELKEIITTQSNTSNENPSSRLNLNR
tara:strand:+ start:981 stop:1586 length:606 start_codon:yes stop_codon:yes gene_type:complete